MGDGMAATFHHGLAFAVSAVTAKRGIYGAMPCSRHPPDQRIIAPVQIMCGKHFTQAAMGNIGFGCDHYP